jgi:hypothetical protein
MTEFSLNDTSQDLLIHTATEARRFGNALARVGLEAEAALVHSQLENTGYSQMGDDKIFPPVRLKNGLDLEPLVRDLL